MSRIKRPALILILSLTATTGCGTLASTKFEYGPRIYGGTRYDLDDLAIQGFPLGTLCGLLDFPFSFTVDTLMLPYTIVEACTAEPPGTVVLDGFIIEAERADIMEVEVVPSGPLPDRIRPLSGATVRVGSLTATTDKSGYFVLRRPPGEEWKTVRVECRDHRPVDIDLSELKSLETRRYWQEHSLRIRLRKS